MFGFFKRRSKAAKPSKPVSWDLDAYRAEFLRLKEGLYDKFAVEHTEYDVLLDAMASVDHEMNHNGGGNWNSGDYYQYLDAIADILLSGDQVPPEELTKIRSSLDEIAECG